MAKEKANFYVGIPKDFGTVKNKIIFGLTARQVFCFSCALIMGVPVYILLSRITDANVAMLGMMCVAAPWFVFALYTKNGQPLEKVLKQAFVEKFWKKQERPVKYEPPLLGVEQCVQYKEMCDERRNKGADSGLLKGTTKKHKKTINPNDKSSYELLSDYASLMHKSGRNRKRPPKSAASSLPFRSLSEDGIMHIKGNKYSIMLAFDDINYEQANLGTQKDIWSEWCMLLNTFDTDVNYQFVFHNRFADIEETAKKLRLDAATGDENIDQMAEELNAYIYDLLKKGNKGLEKGMYLIITFSASWMRLREKADEIKERFSREFAEKMATQTHWLDGYERLAILHHMVNPYKDEKFLFSWKPGENGLLTEKEQLCNHAFTFGNQIDTFRVGSKVGTVSFLKIGANKLSDRFFSEFLNLDSEITISFHIEAIKQDKSLKLVKRLLSDLQKMVIDEQKGAVNNGYGMNNISPELKRNVEAAEELLDNVSMDDEKLFYVTMTMLQIADNTSKLIRNYNAARAIASAQTCELIRLDHQQEDGYFSTLPIGWNALSIKRLLTTTALGIFLPFKIRELLQFGESICIGYNKITEHIIMADIKKLQNPNMIILGKPGRGKSFFVKLLMIQIMLKTKDDIICLDPEGEYEPLVDIFHGQLVKLYTGSDMFINPLDMGTDVEDEEVALADKATFVMSMFEQILRGKSKSDPQDRSIIDRALRKIYSRFLNEKNPDDLPTFTELHKAIKSEDGERAKYLADTFEVYVHGSLNYFNHRTNVDMDNRFLCFDIRDLSTELKELGMLFVQETVWSRVSANREAKKHTRYFIDEMHILLRDPQTAAYTRDIWKRFRKWLGMPCGITQNLTDLMASPEIKTIFDNSDCYVILGQDENEATMLAEELNLTAKQRKCIATRNGGEGLFIYGGTVMPYVGRIPEAGLIYQTITTKYAEK